MRRIRTLPATLLVLALAASSRAATPPPPDAQPFRIPTDNIPQAEIAGVIFPAKGKANGTLFFCHGYGGRKEDHFGWEWIRKELSWNLVFFDFREHGESTQTSHLCTFGYHEIWDVKAVIDYAQSRKLAEPYAIFGSSLGASTGLRWACQDARIKAVIAVSPFRDALRASEQYLQARYDVPVTPFRFHRGFAAMLREVDLPAAVKARDDLRLTIMVGQHDYFTPADARAIYDACPSPARLKRLYVIPGGGHGCFWAWKGNADVPSHDDIIRQTLRAV